MPRRDWPAGQALRAVLERFYGKCLELDIPVMAHAKCSRGAVPACRDRSSPDNWRSLLTTPGFEKLRIDAGHFGGNHAVTSAGHGWSDEFVALMNSGTHFHADIGFWDQLANGDPTVVRKMKRLMARGIGHGQTAASRILYGSDWFMTALLDHWPSCADDIHASLGGAGVGETDLKRLMFRNALALYGLEEAAPGKNLERLRRYYTRTGVTPGWMLQTN